MDALADIKTPVAGAKVLRTLDDSPLQTDAYIRQQRSIPHSSLGRSTRKRDKAGVYARADAEVDLIVAQYFDGLTLSAIAARLGRTVDYVSRVFHSPRGRMLVQLRKRERVELAEELQDRIAYAAQAALDNIIDLAANAASENIRLSASKEIVDHALPKQRAGVALQVNIGDDAIANALAAMAQVRDYQKTVEVESGPEA